MPLLHIQVPTLFHALQTWLLWPAIRVDRGWCISWAICSLCRGRPPKCWTEIQQLALIGSSRHSQAVLRGKNRTHHIGCTGATDCEPITMYMYICLCIYVYVYMYVYIYICSTCASSGARPACTSYCKFWMRLQWPLTSHWRAKVNRLLLEASKHMAGTGWTSKVRFKSNSDSIELPELRSLKQCLQALLQMGRFFWAIVVIFCLRVAKGKTRDLLPSLRTEREESVSVCLHTAHWHH